MSFRAIVRFVLFATLAAALCCFVTVLVLMSVSDMTLYEVITHHTTSRSLPALFLITFLLVFEFFFAKETQKKFGSPEDDE